MVFRYYIGEGVTNTRGIKYGVYNGSNWQFTVIDADSSGSKNFDNPVIAIDSLGDVHIVYQYSDPTDYYVRYATNHSESWVNSTVVTCKNSGIDELHDPCVVIDENNIVHVSYVREDNQNDYYGNYYYTSKGRTDASFPLAQKLIDVVSEEKNYYYSPSVSDGSALYFTYYDEVYNESWELQNSTSYIHTNQSGSWQREQVYSDNLRVTGPVGVYGVNSNLYLLMDSVAADWSESYFFAMANYGSGWVTGTANIFPDLIAEGDYINEKTFVVGSSGDFMLVIEYDNLKKISSLTGTSDDFGLSIPPADVEITAFDAISNVSAGTAGSATYANAAEVIAALPTTATANTSAVTVPVTTWVDTDSKLL